MTVDLALIQSAAAFTPIIFEPSDRRGVTLPNPPRQRNVNVSSTPVLDDDSEDPLKKYFLEAATQRALQQKTAGQIEERLRELRVEAQANSDAFSDASMSDLREFIRSIGATKRPGVFLLDNGNIRALWRNLGAGEQVGLQFLGGGRVQFVIFSRRESPRMMMRAAGVDSVSEARARLIRDHVRHLIV